MSLFGAPRSTSARERSPRLVLLFAVCTALGVSAAAAVILVVVRQTETARAQGQAIDRAQFAARAVLQPELRTADLSGRVTGARRRQLDRLFAGRVLLEGIRGATVYGANGNPTYSTHPGAAASATRSRLAAAYAGTVVSEITSGGDGSRVLRTFIPLGSTSKARGVISLDQEYAHIEAAVRRSSWLIAGVLEALLILLLLIFVPLLARVSDRIRRHIAEVEHVATHDELTSLPNRAGFRSAVQELLTEGGSGAVLLVDLDGFTEINDSLGGHSGDSLLSQVADLLREELSDCRLVARLGEDEFGVLLRRVGHAEVEAVSRRVRKCLTPPFAVGDTRVAVSASIGAAFVSPGLDVETALRRASVALSTAKEEGQSHVQVYGPGHESSDVSRLSLVAELHAALAADELLVYYQPQTDLTTQRIRGVEALLRWQHPVRGLLTAGEFVSHVERGGLATEVRNFLLATAGSHWREWNALGFDLELALNLSPVDMLDASLPDEIAAALNRYGISPGHLILEITERTLIGDERRAGQIIDRLVSLGVRLAIDDFGTGYSSLASLRRYPIHQVKLDRSLLAGVPGNAGAEAVVGGSVEIAHGVGATVVAEGVETREQLRFVSLMGCDIAQGDLIGRPLTAQGLCDRLESPRLVPLTVA